MTSSHIWLQNTNKASSYFSKFWWCSRSSYEALALYLLTRKHYLGFQNPIAVWVLILNHTLAFRNICLQNTNQASSCFLKVWWWFQIPYESLALYILAWNHYFCFWHLFAVLLLILNHTHDIKSYLTPKHKPSFLLLLKRFDGIAEVHSSLWLCIF